MEKETLPDIEQNNEVKIYNPNNIAEVLSLGKDLPTQPDKVYRSVRTEEAIQDITKSGVVRNKQSAGLVEKSRWNDTVFWSKGVEGKYHSVPAEGYVIEAPLSVAQERVVNQEDITAIYKRDENHTVVNILNQKQESLKERNDVTAQKLASLRISMGMDEK